MDKILIVEDDLDIAELERDYLEINGYHVELCHDGKEGLDMILQNNYDLVVLDVMLPSMDGFAIIKEVRKKKEVPVMMVTAKSSDVDKMRGLGLGIDDYMTKPFSPQELVARVRAHIARFRRLVNNEGESDIIDLKGLVIDPSSRRVHLLGNEIMLTTKEFDLLHFLMKHPDHVFSKERLFREVWDADGVGDITTVAVHVRKLREKIEKGQSNLQFIETVWGAGYRFVL